MKDTGKMIAKWRVKRGLSISDLADNLKVKESLIQKWEDGTKKPSLFQIKKLANLFKVKISSLIDDELLLDSLIKKNRYNFLKNMLICLLTTFLLVSLLFNCLNTNNMYTFNGVSDHFRLQDGFIILSPAKRFISLSGFTMTNDIDVESMVINVSFNENIWSSTEYHAEDDKTVKDWLNNLTISESGRRKYKKADSFIKYKNKSFPDDFKIEIVYCEKDNKCHTEIMSIKKSALKLDNKKIEQSGI